MKKSTPPPDTRAQGITTLRKQHRGKNVRNLNANEIKELLLLLALEMGVVDANGNITEP